MFKLFKTDAGETIKYNTETGESWILSTSYVWVVIEAQTSGGTGIG